MISNKIQKGSVARRIILFSLLLVVGFGFLNLAPHLLSPKSAHAECQEYLVSRVTAIDPNDKLISIGYSTLYHILDSDTIEYTIRFENKADATAAAQLVTVTDPLSSDLDWSTFEFGDMEFSNHRIEVPEGLKYYKTSPEERIDLRPEGNNLLVEIEASLDPSTGIATWTFTAIDPETGALTEDPLAGFLPPNGENHEGEGFVKFRISPKANLATGTKINNMATIVFDWNAPIDTPPVFNTIDTGAPASHVMALPTQSREQFEVSWTGQDDTDGSGIASYDIYVSENSGPYQLWLDDTTATSAMFTGVGEYRFYSIATDHVGNQEKAPAELDAVTTAIENNPPSTPIPGFPGHMGTVSTATPILSVNNSTDPDGDALTYDFEIYMKNTEPLPPPRPSASGVSEGEATTAWTCDTELAGYSWYAWRARAFDGIDYSDWTEGTLFFVSVENAPPSVPTISAPLDQAEMDTLQLTLVIENSIDPDGDGLTYHFEVYADEAMTTQVASGSASETEELTSWMVTEELTDNTWYHWRVRAADATAYSLWQYGRFFVNTANDPPASFAISSPQDNTEVDTLQPTLEVTNSTDANHDLLTYTFEVYADSGMSTLIASESDIEGGKHGTTCWQVSSALTESTPYFWRAIATDAHGAQTATPLASFLVNTLNHAPVMAGMASPASGSEVETQALDLIVTNASDEDADGLTYIFELDRVNTFDSPAKLTSGQIQEGTNTTSWHVSDLADNTRYFWRAKASDGAAESAWVCGSFFVNTANDNPATPTVKNPGPMAWLETLTPALEVNPSTDVDLDSVSYEFELYADASLNTLVAQGTSDTSAWEVPSSLTDKTWYYWRARAKDAHDAISAWTDPVSFFVKEGGTEVTLDLDAGWSLVSLPIDATDKKLKAVFPNAVVVYRYEKGAGYVRVKADEALTVGKGYWILLDEATSYTITGQPIASYTRPASDKEWAMIGGCTYSAKVFPDGCNIGVIYRYVRGTGYQRVTGHLEPGEGYWILLTNVAEGAMITVETVD